LNHQLDKIGPNALAIYERLLSENEAIKGAGTYAAAESRCIRSIIYGVINPMVEQLAQSQV